MNEEIERMTAHIAHLERELMEHKGLVKWWQDSSDWWQDALREYRDYCQSRHG